jgi:hypothetical protein
MRTMMPVTHEILEAARALLVKRRAEAEARAARQFWGAHIKDGVSSILEALVDGKYKTIDVEWWRNLFVEPFEAANSAKLDAIAAMADPVRNPNEHERRVAERKLAEMTAKKSPSPPGLEEYDRREAQRAAKRADASGGVNAKASPAGVNAAGADGGVNAAPKHKVDRRKGDRHTPGYMRDYMRRRRAARKTP